MTSTPDPVSPPETASLELRARRFSLLGRLAAIVVGQLIVVTVLIWVGVEWELQPWLAALTAFGLTLLPVLWALERFVRPWHRTLAAMTDGIRSFRDHDFSVRLRATRKDELGDLLRLYNTVGEILLEERQQIRQRELLLQTALDRSPIAIVLVNELDRVLYANVEARVLFLGGNKLQGLHFGELLARCPPEMRAVLDAGRDGIFMVDVDPDPETYHVSRRRFTLNRRSHSLYLVRRMTTELARQEVEVWKKLIRILSHELNNSLAPISSLAHSARLMARDPDRRHQLDDLFDGIRDRVQHLTRFLEGYARFARLPRPEREVVVWKPWLEELRRTQPFTIDGQPPATPGFFDPAQLEQVLINLVKNASEASEDASEVHVRVELLGDGRTLLQVLDRGVGMDEQVLRSALLPFYSTKPTGTGVGLPLCREIVEAHGGTLRIQSSPGEGTTVSLWLPEAIAPFGEDATPDGSG